MLKVIIENSPVFLAGAVVGALVVVSSKAAYAWVLKQRNAAVAKVQPK